MKKFLTQWLLFKSYERKALITLSVLILLSITLPELYSSFSRPTSLYPVPDSTWLTLEASYSSANDSSKPFLQQKNVYNPPSYFYFNPNTLSADSFQLLGLSEKQAQLITEIRAKGFTFKNEDDWLKYRYISDEKKEELLPWIELPKKKQSSKTDYANNNFSQKNRKLLDLNLADSTELEQLPGIGPTLSKRIIKYRNKLGGFNSFQQLSEVWGLQDSVIQKIKLLATINPTNIKKIAVNLCSQEDLQQHPYTGKRFGAILFRYKNEHGNFKSIEDIQAIKAIPDSVTNKILPYLDFRNE